MFIEQGIQGLTFESICWDHFNFFSLNTRSSSINTCNCLPNVKKGRSFQRSNDVMMRFFEPNLTFSCLSRLYLLFMDSILVVNICIIKRFYPLPLQGKMDWSRVWFAFSIWSLFTILSTIVYYYMAPEDLTILKPHHQLFYL
jgi:hypothetical protein